ncbi:hypothetical protein BKA70DRAFT_1435018 [Coprinopsis sp. MPI-PUGE-AT-0042]|nr:hypothetical protein BKA70DRAFT_1435018 [Coprinopsis sp. MPI-PUGE-AT-0042]
MRGASQHFREMRTRDQEWERILSWSRDARREQERERQFARIQALSQERRRKPAEPIGYPWSVTRAEMDFMSTFDSADAFRLWKEIMVYWFPSRSGFTVIENWVPPDPERRWTFNPVQLDLAVLWAGSESPLAIVQIHPPEEGPIRQASTEVRLKASAEKVFERVAMWSSHPHLLMISGLGTQWNAFMGSTDLMAREGLIGEGSDWFGPSWEDCVTSEESFHIMSLCISEIKNYVSV